MAAGLVYIGIEHPEVPLILGWLEVEPGGALPLTVDIPYTRAFLRDETLVTTRATLLDDYPALAVDSPLWGAGQAEDHVADLVSVPISHQGVRCGAFGFITRAQRDWSLGDFVTLEGT